MLRLSGQLLGILLPPPLLAHSLRAVAILAAAVLVGSSCAPPEQAKPPESTEVVTLEVDGEAELGPPPPVPFDSVSVADLRAAALSALEQRRADTLSVEVQDSLRVFAGRLFSSEHCHLFVQISDRGPNSSYEVVSGIFELDDWRPSSEPVLVERTGGMDYIADTLRDANGDGLRDYIVRSYSSTGCCRRDAHWVYLFDSASGGFAEPFRLMNPTYYPAERVVRGVEYGHPGWVPLYKARFTGLGEPQEVECIYRVREREGWFIRGRCGQGGERPEGDTLRALPSEYASVEELSWFMLPLR